jgi:microcystin-dependent protein
MLPKLNGCVALGAGNGTGLTPRPWAKGGGEAEVVLSINQIPSHSHSVVCVSASATASSPTNNLWANVPRGQTAAYGATNDSSMGGLAVGQCGGNQAHNNMQPYLGLTYMIATEGVYPLKA